MLKLTMFTINELSEIHIELTNKCNAACPSCPRNYQGGATREWISNEEISLEDLKSYLPPKILENINKITFCGDYGDPSLCTDLIEIIQYLNQFSIAIQINTNGSTRTEAFWKNLAGALNEKSKVIFSIDGLEDTNHIYRRGTRWEKIIKNIEAFKDSKALKVWEYLVFEHNKHQVEEAKRLSKDLLFDDILFKTPFGFEDGTLDYPLMGVYNKSKELDYFIYPKDHRTPEEVERKLKFLKKRLPIAKIVPLTFNKMNEEQDRNNTHAIECRMKKKKEVYINASGDVFPCCFFSAYFPQKDSHSISNQFIKFYRQYIYGKNSLKKQSLTKIIESGIFSKIEGFWFHKEEKLEICSKFCEKNEGCFSNLYEI
jgi:MoaA/NifB/PqqE/SkfB family radical SAM enzyme